MSVGDLLWRRQPSSMRSFVSRIMDLNEQPHDWRFELAAQLALVGCIALPPDLVEKVLAVVLRPERSHLQSLREFSKGPDVDAIGSLQNAGTEKHQDTAYQSRKLSNGTQSA
jgi:hypothetical protein